MFDEVLDALAPPDERAARQAVELHTRLTKPVGALGRLESIGVQLAAIAGVAPPPVPDRATVVVFAGDHGVVAEGVTPWPQEVTSQMVANICAGGAAVNVLAGAAGARVLVVDVGVAGHLEPHRSLVPRPVARGTANLAVEAAMTLDQARRALDVGVEVAAGLVARGAGCLLTGDMGIANTTPAAALIATFTGLPPSEVTGRGTGIDDVMLRGKVEVVERALALHRPGRHDPLAALAAVGGFEIAALAGFVVAGAAAHLPVLLDGVVPLAALEVAAALAPDCVSYCVAGHRSTEPGASAVLEHLGLVPVLDLELRLGEGTGACLALPVVQAAARVLREMATFDSAGVAHKDAPAHPHKDS